MLAQNSWLKPQVHRQAVNRVEMLRVNGIDHHHVRMAALREAIRQFVIHFAMLKLRHERHHSRRRAPCPYPDKAIGFGDWKAREARHEGALRLAGNLDAAAFCIILPVMKQTANGVALDLAFGQMRAHVHTVSVERDSAPVRAAIDDHLAPQKVERPRPTARQLVGAHRPVPPFGDAFSVVEDSVFSQRSHGLSGASKSTADDAQAL